MSRSIWYIGGSLNNYENIVNFAGFKQSILNKFNDADFTYIDGKSTYLSNVIINQINSNADLLVIDGNAVVYSDNDNNTVLNINNENVDSILVPVITCGVNKCTNIQDNFLNDISIVSNKSLLMSVLFSDILDSLQDNNISTSNTYISAPYSIAAIGDIDSEIFNSDALKVGISSASIDYNTFKMLYKEAIKRFNAKLFVIDNEMIVDDSVNSKKNILAELAGDNSNYSMISDDLYNELFPPSNSGAALHVGVHKKMDIVFGDNLLAASICIGNNIPFVGIGNDSVLDSFLINYNLNGCIKLSSDIRKNINEILDRYNYIDEIRNNGLFAKEQMIYSLDSFTNKIIL